LTFFVILRRQFSSIQQSFYRKLMAYSVIINGHLRAVLWTRPIQGRILMTEPNKKCHCAVATHRANPCRSARGHLVAPRSYKPATL